MSIAQAIRNLRNSGGESQQVFATRLGISIRGLSNYEAGRLPPLELLLKLAIAAAETNQLEIVTALREGINHYIPWDVLHKLQDLEKALRRRIA